MLFLFALCRALHCPHPSRLAAPPWSLSSEQLAQWRHVWETDPWGELRADRRTFAAVACLLAPHSEGGAEELPAITQWPYWLPEAPGPDLNMLAAHRRQWGYGAPSS